jgi:hypothetical protein
LSPDPDGTSPCGAWVVIVDRRRPDLYAWLRRRLGAQADVVLDRRGNVLERRRNGRSDPRDDRREPMTVAEASTWNSWGYRVTFRRPCVPTEEASIRALVQSLAVAAQQEPLARWSAAPPIAPPVASRRASRRVDRAAPA